MTQFRVFLNRMLGLVRGRRADAALQYEMQTHLDLLAAAHVRSGLSAEAARDAARRDFGGIDQVKERHRDRRGFPLLTGALSRHPLCIAQQANCTHGPNVR